MALRALLFSKDPETNTVVSNVCQGAGVRLEVCDDIFTAMEKGTKNSFAVIFVDWSSQPEAGFLVKRARESAPNKEFAAVAIVNREPSATEMREHRLQFCIHRPLAADEVRQVLSGAVQKVDPEAESNLSAAEAAPVEAAGPAATASAAGSDQAPPVDAKFSFEWSEDRPNEGESAEGEEESPKRDYAAIARQFFAAVLSLVALLYLWNGHALILGFMKSPENKAAALRECVVAYFHLEPPDVMPVIGAKPEAPANTAPSATASDNPAPQSPQLQVVEGEPTLDPSREQLRKASDFPLPAPQLQAAAPPPLNARRATIPDSIRSSAPIAPPMVVTVNPSQMMPVSAPSIPVPSSQTLNEPVTVSEETARGLLLHSVNPDYPAEAAAQKLRGLVVLQATIGRDGSVEDLKIVRGYFVLGRAAIAAVKQWQFKPYTVNGKPARALTQITVSFDSPQG
jgi:TonB family protein